MPARPMRGAPDVVVIGGGPATTLLADAGQRAQVLERFPRCHIHDHHLLFRSRGRGNVRDNRITVCVWHHLRGIHQGRVRAWGSAPDAITCQLGCRPGSPRSSRCRAIGTWRVTAM